MPSRRVFSDLRQTLIRQDRQVRKELTLECVKYGNAKAQHFRQVVSDWNGKPRFDVRSKVDSHLIQVHVTPRGEHAAKWYYVDLGTGSHVDGGQPYEIRPKRANALKFQTGYSAKTRPVAAYGLGDGSRSGQWVTVKPPKVVRHPGIKGRKFDETYDTAHITQLRADLENAIRRGVRRF